MSVTTRRRSACFISVVSLFGTPMAVAQHDAAAEDLEEIVVTGSRIQQRLEDAPVAVVVLNREDIDRASEDAIGKLLQQLPANTGSPVNTNVNNGGDGSVRVDLRGFGAARTLVLMNGRRFVYGGVGGDTSVDVNMIPSSILERVEVMGVGSSTVYGSDAIGGVVNFITREDFDGAQIDLSYTQSEDGDGSIGRVGFFAGQTSERGYLIFGGELVDQDSVFQDARDFSTDTEYLRADGSVGTTGSPVTPQGSFRVPTGNAFGLTPGIYTRVTGSGEPTTAADFRLYVNPDDNFNFAPDNYLQTPSQRQYAWLLGGYDIAPGLELFVEGLLHHRESEQRLAASSFRSGSAGAILPNGRPGVPASNYYNPFGVDLVGVLRRIEEQGGRLFTQDVDTQRYVAGLRGALGADWNWELSATYGRNDTIATTEGDFLVDRLRLAVGPSGPDASGRIVCGKRDPATGLVPAGNVVAGCVPLNLFGGMGPDGKGTITPEQLDYVTDPLTDEGYNEQQIYELVLRGDWGTVQGRPIRWATGVTYRVEAAGNELDPAKLSGATGGGTLTSLSGGRFTATEGYVETMLPLLEGLPAADALNLTAGLRLSEFSTFGFVSTYQGGLMYRPVRPLTLRAGYGTVFRAPPVTNIYESTLENFTGARDPCGNDPTPQQRENCAANGVPGGSYVQPVLDFTPDVIGGNPDLEPEEGDSVSAGFTFTPSVPDGLSLSVDYWRTKIDDVISLYPDSGLILQVCADEGASGACGRISRFPDGTLERIDATHVNAARLMSEGWDFDVAYATPVGPGQLGLRLMATYLASYDIAPFAGADTIGAAGTRYVFGAFPRWRGLGHVEYSAGPWFGSWQTQYVGSMDECEVNEFAPADAFQGCREIDEGWYQDLQLGYRFEPGPELRVTISNLTNEDPPRVNFNAAANTDPATYSLLGRTYFVSLSYRIE
jgi:outer membrane receptor protein involved in Fe transport